MGGEHQTGYDYLLNHLMDAKVLHTEDEMIKLGNNCFLHKSVILGSNVKLGVGVVIEKNCKVGDNTIIANYAIMRPNVIIGEDCKIGHHVVFEGDTNVHNCVTIQSLSEVCRFSTIEDHVFIGPHFSGADEPFIANSIRRTYPKYAIVDQLGQHFGRGVRVGNDVSAIPGVKVGANAFVGVGSLLTKNVPEGQLWLGRPAQYVKDVPMDEWV